MIQDLLRHEKYIEYIYSKDMEFYLKILENCLCDIYVIDRNERIIYVNPTSVNTYGLKPEEIIGMKNEHIWKGRWTPSAFETCMHEKRVIYAKQHYLKTGKEVDTVLCPVIDDDGEVEMIVTIATSPRDVYDLNYRDYRESSGKSQSTISENRNKNINASSYELNMVLNTLRKVSNSKVTVLLLGESGTGKTTLAEYIHTQSDRRDAPFVSLNCTTISETLLESEMFGYAPHSFTGANSKGKKGLVEIADGGTVFLDEIGDLPLNLQAKLLDFIENQRFYPVGDNRIRSVDVRIICATNVNLEQKVLQKKFREDLYWRINTISVTVPPLRECRDEIFPLVNSFLDRYNKEFSRNVSLAPDTMSILLTYDWPGNIRQLKNTIQRLVLLSNKTTTLIHPNSLPDFMLKDREQYSRTNKSSYDLIIENVSRQIIRESYKKTFNMKKVAEELGISHSKAFRLVSMYCKDLMK